MNNNIPEVRFEGYSNNWKKYKLKNLATYSNGGIYEKDVTSNGNYELITLKSVNMQGNLVSSGKYIDKKGPTLNKGTLVMILSEQSPGLLGMTTIIPEDNRYILNQRVAEILPNKDVSSYFLSMALNKNQRLFSRLGAGTKVQNISKYNVENFAIYCPSKEEQKEIGSFFKLLDEKIQLNQHALDLLKQRKKAFLQKMLPKKGEIIPEIRFSGFSEVWHQTRLDDLLSYEQPTKYLVDSANYEDSFSTPVLTAGKTFILGYTNESKGIYDKGDVILFDDFTTDFRFIDFPFKVKSSATKLLTPKENFDLRFLFEAMKGIQYPTNEHKRYWISEFTSLKISVPKSIEEQKKIGNLFKELNNSITFQEEKIESLKQMKKAFLQKMFV